MTCIKRNIDAECVPEVQTSSWQCCCCRPVLLQKLTLELDKAIGSGKFVVSSSESESEDSDADCLDVSLRYNAHLSASKTEPLTICSAFNFLFKHFILEA